MTSRVRWAVVATLGLLAMPMFPDASWSQPPAAPSGLTVSAPAEGDLVEGRISRVDPRAGTITLDNGREYHLSPPLHPNWTLVRPGATVRMRYGASDGQNLVATQIEIRP